MYVQVIKGQTKDKAALRRQSERWRDEVRPGAIGFLGSTVGIAEDGTFVAIARFADEAAARANNDRPEQTAWWQETSKYFDGEPTFRESSDTTELFDGGSDKAGFVQVMEGTVTDRAKVQELETPEMMEQLRAARPDLLGSLRVWMPGGAFVDTAYFTSEADARAGESSGAFEGPQQEYGALFGEMTFTDLRDPMLTGPGG
jgi:quinol monooxygenase YgiN